MVTTNTETRRIQEITLKYSFEELNAETGITKDVFNEISLNACVYANQLYYAIEADIKKALTDDESQDQP